MSETHVRKSRGSRRELLWMLLAALAAFCSALSLGIDFSQEKLLESFHGYDAVYVALWVPLYLLFRRAFALKSRRTRCYGLAAALLLALNSLFGRVILETQTLAAMVRSGAALWQNLLYFLGRLALYYGVVTVVFDWLVRRSEAWSQPRPIRHGRWPFFALWGGLMLCWIVYLFIFYPGLLSEDSFNQVAQALGEAPLVNDNPLAHTMLIALFLHLGRRLGDINRGVLLYAVFQMLAMSGIFALCVNHLRRKGLPRRLWVPAACVWAFLPVYPIFGMTLWKDILLGGSVVLLGLQVIGMLERREDYFAKRWRIFALLGTGLLMSLIKTNGITVYLPTLLLLLPFLPRLRKWLAVCAATITALFLLVQGPLYGALGVQQGSTREVLSLPIQQVSRIMLLHQDEIDPFDVDTYYAFFPMDGQAELAERYNWTISDPIKEVFDEWTYEHSSGAFFQLWGKLLLRYPAEAFDQVLGSTLGYWYPEMQQWIYYLNTRPNTYGIEAADTGGVSTELRTFLHREFLPGLRQIPVVAMALSIGFSFVLMLLAFLLTMRKRQSLWLLAFLPAILMWVNALLSPVNCEYRYAFGMTASIPLLLPYVAALPTLSPKRKKAQVTP